MPNTEKRENRNKKRKLANWQKRRNFALKQLRENISAKKLKNKYLQVKLAVFYWKHWNSLGLALVIFLKQKVLYYIYMEKNFIEFFDTIFPIEVQ